MMEKMLFIVGVGRSGTTLLQSMLNAHPDIAFTPETHFIKKYIVPWFAGKCRLDDALRARQKEDPDLKRLQLPGDAFADALKDGNDPVEQFRNLLAAYVRRADKRHAGDKDPLNIEYLPQIRKAFPDAYVLHIIRDPRDVMLSRVRSDWGKGRPLLAHICEHRAHLGKARREGPAFFGDRYIELFYEDLVRAPENTLTRVCERVGMEYSTDMLRYQEDAEQLVHGAERKWKGEVLKPLQKAKIGRWKEELSAGRVRLIEGALRDEMLETGYAPNGHGLSWVRAWTSLPLWLCEKAFALKAYRQSAKLV